MAIPGSVHFVALYGEVLQSCHNLSLSWQVNEYLHNSQTCKHTALKYFKVHVLQSALKKCLCEHAYVGHTFHTPVLIITTNRTCHCMHKIEVVQWVMLYTFITVMVLGVVHRCQSLGERMSRDISQRNGMRKTFNLLPEECLFLIIMISIMITTAKCIFQVCIYVGKNSSHASPPHAYRHNMR